jgi:PilZ domain-containing protein
MVMEPPTGSEKRVFSRIPCLVDLEVRADDQSPKKVEAVDLSLLGVGFDTEKDDRTLTPGDSVTVGMHGLLPVQGQVRWNSGQRVGVQFCGRFHDIMESWVGEVLSAQGVRVQDVFLTR